MVLKLLHTPPPPKLSDRQRAILRGYFAAECRLLHAARALGISPHRVSEVKALPAARVYLYAIVQARPQTTLRESR